MKYKASNTCTVALFFALFSCHLETGWMAKRKVEVDDSGEDSSGSMARGSVRSDGSEGDFAFPAAVTNADGSESFRPTRTLHRTSTAHVHKKLERRHLVTSYSSPALKELSGYDRRFGSASRAEDMHYMHGTDVLQPLTEDPAVVPPSLFPPSPLLPNSPKLPEHIDHTIIPAINSPSSGISAGPSSPVDLRSSSETPRLAVVDIPDLNSAAPSPLPTPTTTSDGDTAPVIPSGTTAAVPPSHPITGDVRTPRHVFINKDERRHHPYAPAGAHRPSALRVERDEGGRPSAFGRSNRNGQVQRPRHGRDHASTGLIQQEGHLSDTYVNVCIEVDTDDDEQMRQDGLSADEDADADVDTDVEERSRQPTGVTSSQEGVLHAEEAERKRNEEEAVRQQTLQAEQKREEQAQRDRDAEAERKRNEEEAVRRQTLQAEREREERAQREDSTGDVKGRDGDRREPRRDRYDDRKDYSSRRDRDRSRERPRYDERRRDRDDRGVEPRRDEGRQRERDFDRRDGRRDYDRRDRDRGYEDRGGGSKRVGRDRQRSASPPPARLRKRNEEEA
ncbi:hypothetical protein PENSPDRAFT_670281, partial [Peniophora sp. CONT]